MVWGEAGIRMLQLCSSECSKTFPVSSVYVKGLCQTPQLCPSFTFLWQISLCIFLILIANYPNMSYKTETIWIVTKLVIDDWGISMCDDSPFCSTQLSFTRRLSWGYLGVCSVTFLALVVKANQRQFMCSSLDPIKKN